MRVDLAEGFELAEMAPFIGWGRIKLPPWIEERYFSVRAFGRTLFVCRCRFRPELGWVGNIIGGLSASEKRYYRWWLQ